MIDLSAPYPPTGSAYNLACTLIDTPAWCYSHGYAPSLNCRRDAGSMLADQSVFCEQAVPTVCFYPTSFALNQPVQPNVDSETCAKNCCADTTFDTAGFVSAPWPCYGSGWQWMPPQCNADEFTAALHSANSVLSRTQMPGGAPYYPIAASSAFCDMAWHVGGSGVCAAVAASYFQRIIVTCPDFAAVVRCNAQFCNENAAILAYVEAKERVQCKARNNSAANQFGVERGAIASVTAAVCIHLAFKMVETRETVQSLVGVLRTLLGIDVQHSTAVDLEICCMRRLDFRLGPYSYNNDNED